MKKAADETKSIVELVLAQLSQTRSAGFGLRMAPMIDVIFLLLIFFLVTADFRPIEDFLPFKLPTAQGGLAQPGVVEPLVLYIAADPKGCTIQIGTEEAFALSSETIAEDLAGFMNELQRVMDRHKRLKSDAVEIDCMGQVKWDYLAKVYNVLYGFGFTDISFRLTE